MISTFFEAQDQLFIPGPAFLLAAHDRYRLFAQKVMPALIRARPMLAKLYCSTNGRPPVEPVTLLALSVLQFWERVPDAQAVALLNYHCGWAYALGWQIGQPLFHPCALSRFRERLLEHKQGALAFNQLLKELIDEGLIRPQASRRLDSTFVLALVSYMGRLECVRETLRLTLQELHPQVALQHRPAQWLLWWERYVESQVDYRVESQVLQSKLAQCGTDIFELLTWIDRQPNAPWASADKVQLLRRVYAEQFQPADSSNPTAAPLLQDKTPAGAVKNPNDPQAQWAKKGVGAQKKEVVGYKVQVCEAFEEQPALKQQPTQGFLTAIETQLATGSDERGHQQIEEAEAGQNLPPAPVTYVDAAYISGAKLAQAKAQQRELIGPAPAPPSREGRFSANDFEVQFNPVQARCPAGHLHTRVVEWQDSEMRGMARRFDWEHLCLDCPLRSQCVSPKQTSRTLAIGPHHDLLQARRREQITPEFRQRCKHRNALEGSQSELVRAHGLRRARYRGLEKVRLQNYFIGTACNAKRWIRLLQWRAHHPMAEVCTERAKN